jgi:hypothetical protein
MKLGKRDCVIAVVVGYGFLVMLFFLLKKREYYTWPCSEQNCVRFCCENATACSDESIRKNFKGVVEVEPSLDENNASIPFVALHGRPICNMINAGNKTRKLLTVSCHPKD